MYLTLYLLFFYSSDVNNTVNSEASSSNHTKGHQPKGYIFNLI